MRLIPLLLLLAACLPNIRYTLRGDDDFEGDGGIAVATEDGGISLVMDATDAERWSALDLDGGRVTVEEDSGWDLAFQRFEIKVNGGISGDGGVEVVAVSAMYQDDIEVPAGGWLTDEPDADGDEVPEYALLTWYSYDYETHLLNPAEVVYIVRTSEDALFKLAFDSYYDNSGTPARISLRFAPIN